MVFFKLGFCFVHPHRGRCIAHRLSVGTNSPDHCSGHSSNHSLLEMENRTSFNIFATMFTMPFRFANWAHRVTVLLLDHFMGMVILGIFVLRFFKLLCDFLLNIFFKDSFLQSFFGPFFPASKWAEIITRVLAVEVRRIHPVKVLTLEIYPAENFQQKFIQKKFSYQKTSHQAVQVVRGLCEIAELLAQEILGKQCFSKLFSSVCPKNQCLNFHFSRRTVLSALRSLKKRNWATSSWQEVLAKTYVSQSIVPNWFIEWPRGSNMRQMSLSLRGTRQWN